MTWGRSMPATGMTLPHAWRRCATRAPSFPLTLRAARLTPLGSLPCGTVLDAVLFLAPQPRATARLRSSSPPRRPLGIELQRVTTRGRPVSPPCASRAPPTCCRSAPDGHGFLQLREFLRLSLTFRLRRSFDTPANEPDHELVFRPRLRRRGASHRPSG